MYLHQFRDCSDVATHIRVLEKKDGRSERQVSFIWRLWDASPRLTKWMAFPGDHTRRLVLLAIGLYLDAIIVHNAYSD